MPTAVSAQMVDGSNALDVLGQYDNNSAPSLVPMFTKASFVTRVGLSLTVNTEDSVYLDGVDHRLFVSDSTNNRILVFTLNTDNTLPDHVPDFVLGQSDFNGNVTATSQAGLNIPAGMAYDSASKRLFVADTFSRRVMVFDLSSGITNGMNAQFVLGQSTFTSSTSASTQSGMVGPGAVSYRSSGSLLFVADSSRVLVYDLSSGISNGMNAAHVIGQANFTASTFVSSQSGMRTSVDVAIDASATSSRLFVADRNAARVTVVRHLGQHHGWHERLVRTW